MGLIGHEPCPKCGSQDNVAVYDNGSKHCFSMGCGYHVGGSGEKREKPPAQFVQGEPCAIEIRGLSEETCAKWRYHVGERNGKPCQIANYCDAQGQVVAQKLRFQGKDFEIVGDAKKMGLYGQWLWGQKGKKVVITEGEIDALSVSQAQGNSWPVVSIPNGVQSAKKHIQQALEWLEGFEDVVFMFDNDEHGIPAAKECALLLSPGKAKIATLPLKDANDMLVAGRQKELVKAVWDAKTFRPDGIICGEELWDELATGVAESSIGYPWSGLNNLLHGLRLGELVTFTAGSGIGKSLCCKELAVHLLRNGQRVGYIGLEESIKRTALGLMGISANKPLHLQAGNQVDDQFQAAFKETVGSGRCFLYDHFGSIDSPSLLARIRYMARGCGCNWIIFDHISIMVSGSEESDERRLIDQTMTKLRSLVQETGVGMILVSHLKRTEGKAHEEGGKISLAQLRGSGSIGQLSDIVIGLERDQQDEMNKNMTTFRVLKNRFSGETGVAGQVYYDPETGRLTEQAASVF